MTREEARNRIDAIIAKHEIDDVYVTITNFKDYDALRIARKTLEQEPCEDCISREAVLGCLTATKLKELKKFDLILHAREEIKKLPPVTPKPKTDVLDKIRAEIEQDAIKSVFGTKYIFVNRVNQIIDKYKVEKE